MNIKKFFEHGYTDLYETAKTKSDQRATIAGFYTWLGE